VTRSETGEIKINLERVKTRRDQSRVRLSIATGLMVGPTPER
jgi:hypothetical protein